MMVTSSSVATTLTIESVKSMSAGILSGAVMAILKLLSKEKMTANSFFMASMMVWPSPLATASSRMNSVFAMPAAPNHSRDSAGCNFSGAHIRISYHFCVSGGT